MKMIIMLTANHFHMNKLMFLILHTCSLYSDMFFNPMTNYTNVTCPYKSLFVHTEIHTDVTPSKKV